MLNIKNKFYFIINKKKQKCCKSNGALIEIIEIKNDE